MPSNRNQDDLAQSHFVFRECHWIRGNNLKVSRIAAAMDNRQHFGKTGDPVSASKPFQTVGPAEHRDSTSRLNQAAGTVQLDLERLGHEIRAATVIRALSHESFDL